MLPSLVVRVSSGKMSKKKTKKTFYRNILGNIFFYLLCDLFITFSDATALKEKKKSTNMRHNVLILEP